MNSGARFRNALTRMPQRVPPIWLMRQAGRYHHHYRLLRREHSFVELCKDPRLAAEVALGPVLDFDFDAAILFSDLLFPLEALGMGLGYEESGPRLDPLLTSEGLSSLAPLEVAIERLGFQKEAMAQTHARLPADKSLIGFVGGPWTLFLYAIDGTHRPARREAAGSGALFAAFVERLVPLLIENIRLQLEGGAEVVMILDTAAGQLSPGSFEELLLPWIASMGSAFPGKLGYYSRDAGPAHLRHPLFHSGLLAGVGVDARWDIVEAMGSLAAGGFVQGNFDQAMLAAPAEVFVEALGRYLAPLRRLPPEARAGWVCGLGHGVLPSTPEENVRTFVRAVREAFA